MVALAEAQSGAGVPKVAGFADRGPGVVKGAARHREAGVCPFRGCRRKVAGEIRHGRLIWHDRARHCRAGAGGLAGRIYADAWAVVRPARPRQRAFRAARGLKIHILLPGARTGAPQTKFGASLKDQWRKRSHEQSQVATIDVIPIAPGEDGLNTGP